MRISLHHAILSLLWTASTISATTKSISLDEPFQSSLKNLPHVPCVTLYHRNGRIGCGTATRDPQSGPLLYYDGSSSLRSNSKYVAVIDEFAMSSSTISSLLASNSYGNLKGILVLNSTDSQNSDDYISPGSQYPLGYGTPSAGVAYGNIQFPWNGNGDGLIQYDLFGVPMAYVLGYEASNYIREVAQDSSTAASIVAEFNYYMGPDGVKSSDCLSWRDIGDREWNPKCLPLGGTSVWAHAGSPPQYGRRRLEDGGNGERPTFIVGASVDATSMFHDLAPGANTAASNILSVLMAAKLIGQSLSDSDLDALPKRIVFGFFEGESYGFIGSRNFLNDVMGFECAENAEVNSVSNDEDSEMACLYPLRPSLKFQGLGQIAGMLTVDQTGVPTSDGVLYVHNDGNDGTIGSFVANLLKASGTDTYSVASSAVGENNNGNYPYPPTPLSSLLSLTGGYVGGAVLSGYDYVFVKRPPYHSHFNAVTNIEMNLKSIAASATLLARTALAAAYDDGSLDYDTASAYALNLIGELSYDDETLVELADCLFYDGSCKLLKTYAETEANNEKDRTGFNIGSGVELGTPPNYYVSVYNMYYGQPFVQVGDKAYGAYNGQNYGKKKTDAVSMQPRLLPQALRGLLNDYLGRGNFQSNNGNSVAPRSCSKHSDCKGVSYCSSSGDSATCAGSKYCVCSRAHYHPALDESLSPALNNETGYFIVNDNGNGVSPMYTEPFWSNDVSVKVYRNSKTSPGLISLGIGGAVCMFCFFTTIVIKVGMKKQKVY